MLFLPFKSIEVGSDDAEWTALFKKSWPAYKKWFLKEGMKMRPGYLSSHQAFDAHFPELTDTYTRLCDRVGGGDLTSRFLSMYCPPPYMSGCSQLAWPGASPMLIRNYDYSPRYFEAVFLKTNWLKPVMGMSDCTWGLLDGINADGLCASLTFGGRKLIGKGFGIPLILRYCLETCSNVPEAVKRLLQIPVHMAYNITLMDAELRYATLYFTPGMDNRVTYQPVGTNHQEEINWPDYASMTRTLERKQILEFAMANPLETATSVMDRFLTAPLYNTAYEKAFGTLYTALYHPMQRTARMLWPGKFIDLSLEAFEAKRMQVPLKTNANRLLSI